MVIYLQYCNMLKMRSKAEEGGEEVKEQIRSFGIRYSRGRDIHSTRRRRSGKGSADAAVYVGVHMKISDVKRIREDIGASHVVVFAIVNGRSCVASHGRTEGEADEAATLANMLKRELEWPEELCNSKPIERICDNCAFFNCDNGRSYANGFEPASSGDCLVEPKRSRRGRTEHACRYFEPKI